MSAVAAAPHRPGRFAWFGRMSLSEKAGVVALALITLVKDRVKDKFDVKLETEVVIW